MHRTRPPGSVVPKVTADGRIVCPACGCRAETPTQLNLQTGEIERLILFPHRTLDCPRCGVVQWVTPAVSRKHNRIVYPNDPGCWNAQPLDPEAN